MVHAFSFQALDFPVSTTTRYIIFNIESIETICINESQSQNSFRELWHDLVRLKRQNQIVGHVIIVIIQAVLDQSRSIINVDYDFHVQEYSLSL